MFVHSPTLLAHSRDLELTLDSQGISNFFSQLITSFGFTPRESLLYGAPAGAVEVVTVIAGGWLGDRYGNRLMVASCGMV